MKQTTPREDILRGIWRENPVLIQMLGLCPALAVTNSVENAIAMGLATFFVLFCSSLLVSSCKRFIPHEVRISTYILIIATFVTLADMILQAAVPEIHKELGAFIEGFVKDPVKFRIPPVSAVSIATRTPSIISPRRSRM